MSVDASEVETRVSGREKPAAGVTSLEPPRADDSGAVLARLLSYVGGRGRRLRFWSAVALRAVSVVALTSIPAATGGAVNAMSASPANLEDLRAWVMSAACAVVVFAISSYIAERMFARLATDATQRLQRDMFDRMQELSLSFFDRRPVGQLMSRVSNDTEVVATFNETAVSAMLRSVFQVLLIIVLMFFTNWRLTLAALVVVPVLVVVVLAIARVTLPAFTLMQEQLGDLSGFQEETISGHRVIISSGRQQWAKDGSAQRSGEVFQTGSKATFTALLQFPATQTLTVVQMVVVLVTGGVLSADGQADIGEVIAFVGMAGLLAAPLSDLSNLATSTLSAIAAGRRVFEIIDEVPEIVDAPDATDYDFRGGRVEFVDVDFSYVPGRQILRHNSFTALPGQKIGICGPTGAGKSTIINILTRYYDIDSGAVLLDGQPLQTLRVHSVRDQVGMVLQEAFLFSDTVMANLLYARADATPEHVVEAARQANAHDFIMDLPQGYDTPLTERGANLSQGQRQMLTIARAMVADPSILILDEATSNVDTRTEALIQQGLRRLMSGRTSFVIAHRLSTIADADRILVVDEGRIIESGTHDELLAAGGFYHRLWFSQFRGTVTA